MRPLNEGMFNTVMSMQKQGKKHNDVQDAMDFFGLGTALQFETMRQTVSQVMPQLVTEHGTFASQVGPLHGCEVTWPGLFVHVCEVKQLLNKFGQQLVEELLAKNGTCQCQQLLPCSRLTGRMQNHPSFASAFD